MKEQVSLTGNHIRTFSGKYIDVFNPDPDTILIEDIAHALAVNNRFGGHLPRPRSIAQHSVDVCNLVPAKDKLAGLMHDGSEAYLQDMPKPIKMRLEEYKKVEDLLMKAIAKKFGFEYPKPESVEEADVKMLRYEWDNIMINNDPNVECWTWEHSKKMFLEKFEELTK